jgi:hypothetical protein
MIYVIVKIYHHAKQRNIKYYLRIQQRVFYFGNFIEIPSLSRDVRVLILRQLYKK